MGKYKHILWGLILAFSATTVSADVLQDSGPEFIRVTFSEVSHTGESAQKINFHYCRDSDCAEPLRLGTRDYSLGELREYRAGLQSALDNRAAQSILAAITALTSMIGMYRMQTEISLLSEEILAGHDVNLGSLWSFRAHARVLDGALRKIPQKNSDLELMDPSFAAWDAQNRRK